MQGTEIKTDAKRPSTPLYIDLAAAQTILVVILGAVIGLIGSLPRNADNSLQAIYTIPALLLLSLVSAYLLWKRTLRHHALRIVCWLLIAFAALAIPATLVDLVQRYGS